jgi:hypothetical protein
MTPPTERDLVVWCALQQFVDNHEDAELSAKDVKRLVLAEEMLAELDAKVAALAT